MSKYLDLSVKEINELLINKKITPIDLVRESFKKIEDNKELNAYITLNKDEFFANSRLLREYLKEGSSLNVAKIIKN